MASFMTTSEFQTCKVFLRNLPTERPLSEEEAATGIRLAKTVGNLPIFTRGKYSLVLEHLCHRAKLYPSCSFHSMFMIWLLLVTLCGFLRKPFGAALEFVIQIRKKDKMYIYRILKLGLVYEKEDLSTCECPLKRFLLESILARHEEVCDLYYSKVNRTYAPLKAKERLEVYREELIQKTWHPSRVQWWMSEDERMDIFGTQV